ncbi:MAG: STAS domain-containing protein [Pigmentiphaga sp.]|nr:STAS domain-containing protein [Pigmentiphaga sp.]
MYADAPQLQPPEPFTLFRATALKTWMLAQLDAHPDGLVLDLSGVNNIDTAGVQLLLMIKREAESRACPLTISAPSEPVRALFQLFGLDLEGDGAARSPGE